MSKIADDERAARAMGLSYGKYKALTYKPIPPKPPAKRKQRPRRFSDEEAFLLWQEGHTDSEIAQKVGVSRALIQRWRDILELPLTTKEPIDTKKYRLAQLQDGTAVVLTDEDL